MSAASVEQPSDHGDEPVELKTIVIDRRHDRLHVLTDPDGADYAGHRVHSPGERVVLPRSVGGEVVLDVGEILAAGRRTPGAGQG